MALHLQIFYIFKCLENYRNTNSCSLPVNVRNTFYGISRGREVACSNARQSVAGLKRSRAKKHCRRLRMLTSWHMQIYFNSIHHPFWPVSAGFLSSCSLVQREAGLSNAHVSASLLTFTMSCTFHKMCAFLKPQLGESNLHLNSYGLGFYLFIVLKLLKYICGKEPGTTYDKANKRKPSGYF